MSVIFKDTKNKIPLPQKLRDIENERIATKNTKNNTEKSNKDKTDDQEEIR